MSDDLKPGFYYVRRKGEWTVGQFNLADESWGPWWWIVGDQEPEETNNLEIGAYLDPQPGEQAK
jgi:hypothetical protein